MQKFENLEGCVPCASASFPSVQYSVVAAVSEISGPKIDYSRASFASNVIDRRCSFLGINH